MQLDPSLNMRRFLVPGRDHFPFLSEKEIEREREREREQFTLMATSLVVNENNNRLAILMSTAAMAHVKKRQRLV
jgi:hypothetical protein